LQIDSKNVRFSEPRAGPSDDFIADDSPQTENDSQSGWRIPQIVGRVKRKKRFFLKNFQFYLSSPNFAPLFAAPVP
jgi:hypothetical protein